jgi:hypothetical protein
VGDDAARYNMLKISKIDRYKVNVLPGGGTIIWWQKVSHKE